MILSNYVWLQTLNWAFGINKSLPVFSLSDQDGLAILYACSHVAVIYDHTSNSQHLLQVSFKKDLKLFVCKLKMVMISNLCS